MAADFPNATGPEQRAATAYFAQSPHPPKLMIGRGANKPTKTMNVSSQNAATSPNYPYVLNVHGDGVTDASPTYTSDGTPTVQEWANGMLTALNAVASKNFTAAFSPLAFTSKTFTYAFANELTCTAHGLNTGDGPFQATTTGTLPTGMATVTNYWMVKVDANTLSIATSLANALAGTVVTISGAGSGTDTLNGNTPLSLVLPLVVTGNTAGAWFAIEVPDVNHQSVTDVTTDPGLAADLTAITAENPTGWYGLYTTCNSEAIGVAAAGYCEANGRIYVADTSDSNTVLAAYIPSSTQDLMNACRTNAYSRTLCEYHPQASVMMGAALLGARLSSTPGSETWALAQSNGIPTYPMTETQRNNITNRNGNGYENAFGLNVTFNGMVGNGNFLDVARGLDAFTADATTSLFGAMAGPTKLPYTDPGVAVLQSRLSAAGKRAETAGTFAVGLFNAIAGKVADQPPGDIAARHYNGLTFTATLQGAVQSSNVLGNVAA